MPRKPTLTERIRFKLKKRKIEKHIKTKEQAQTVYDLTRAELQKRKDYFEANKNNVKINYNPELQNYTIKIHDNSNKTISELTITPLKNDVWHVDLLNTGQFNKLTDPNRDLGFAKKLIIETINFVSKNKGVKIIFHTKPSLVNFYKSFGAKPETLKMKDLIYVVQGHVPMSIKLKS